MKEQAQEEMANAANELIDTVLSNRPEDIIVGEDGAILYNAAVTVDGKWQRHGHSSKMLSSAFQEELKPIFVFV